MKLKEPQFVDLLVLGIGAGLAVAAAISYGFALLIGLGLVLAVPAAPIVIWIMHRTELVNYFGPWFGFLLAALLELGYGKLFMWFANGILQKKRFRSLFTATAMLSIAACFIAEVIIFKSESFVVRGTTTSVPGQFLWATTVPFLIFAASLFAAQFSKTSMAET